MLPIVCGLAKIGNVQEPTKQFIRMVFFINKTVHANICVVHVCAKYLTVTHTCDNIQIVLK